MYTQLKLPNMTILLACLHCRHSIHPLPPCSLRSGSIKQVRKETFWNVSVMVSTLTSQSKHEDFVSTWQGQPKHNFAEQLCKLSQLVLVTWCVSSPLAHLAHVRSEQDVSSNTTSTGKLGRLHQSEAFSHFSIA